MTFHDFSDLADVAANVWDISASKMEGAWISLHVASGILKNASLDAEKSGKWWRRPKKSDDGRHEY